MFLRRATAGLGVAIVVVAAARAGDGETFTGTCVAVRDGDTLEVMRAGRAIRVRLWGIDCPERGQAFAAAARQFTARLAHGKEVTVTVVSVDRYHRLVGRVTVDGRDLALALVREGLAWWYAHHAPHARELAAAEAEARQARQGLWGEAAPVPPWTFRRHPAP